MKTTGGTAAAKRRAGERAAEAVEDGMVVGLGTGSTTAYAIDALGTAVEAGLDIRGIPTSLQSRLHAVEAGIPLTTLDAVERVDVAIDGADQVVVTSAERHPRADRADQETARSRANSDSDSAAELAELPTETESSDGPTPNSEPETGIQKMGDSCILIKGGGGAHVREKLVDAAADRFLVVVDSSKLVPTIDRSVPLAVLPEAHRVVADRIRDLDGEPTLRSASKKDGPVVTDDGLVLLDCDFGPISNPELLATQLSELPGVLDHGIFTNLTDTLYVGTETDVDVIEF